MPKYENFYPEDFIQDDFFISWVLHPSKKENEFWSQWQSDFPERKIYLKQARTILLAIRARPVLPEVTDADVEDVLSFVGRHGYRGHPERNRWPKLVSLGWLRVAAMLLVVLTTAFFFYTKIYRTKAPMPGRGLAQWTKFHNKSGQSRIIRMNDGSLAILKPNSTLKYPKGFSDVKRIVFLEGEAFFEVRKDPTKPFLVHSRGMITKVLGTSFTVRSFEDEEDFRVIVNTGKVMVYTPGTDPASPQRSVLVLPRQQAKLKRQHHELIKDTIKTTMLLAKETAENEFSFKKAPIPVVIQKLETAYRVKIGYDSSEFENVTVTASLSDLPLDEKVKLICKAIDATYSFANGTITISKPN